MADIATVQQHEQAISTRKEWIIQRSLNASQTGDIWHPTDHAELVHHIAEIERSYMALVRAAQQSKGGRS
jgi:hypothetical protein